MNNNLLPELIPVLSLLVFFLGLAVLSLYFLTMDNLFAIELQMAVAASISIGEMISSLRPALIFP